MNRIWINVYPPLELDGMPIFRRFKSKEEALRMRLEGCLKTLELRF